VSEWDDAVTKLTGKDWRQITALNDRIQAHKGSWGSMAGGETNADGSIEMPYSVPDPLILEFVQLWYDKDLVVPFDWGGWYDAQKWHQNKDAARYDAIDSETALKLLTAMIRGDRFTEGALVNLFEAGDVPKILNRLVSIRQR